MCAERVTKAKPGEVETTGHVWDGIEEFNNPLPRWWLYSFYACIAYALVYTILFPAWPMLTRATPGLLGASTRADVAAEIARFDATLAPIKAKLVAADLAAIPTDPELGSYATSAGASVFRTNCATCHGSGAAGVQGKGYPNLLDDDWLWGGDMQAIHTTITHGIRNNADPDARYSVMPAFGVDGLLETAQIGQVVEYVLQISGQQHDAAQAVEGAVVYAENCHGEQAEGIRDLGAPTLTDAIWLYGGNRDALTYTIVNARNGVMPPWAPRLSEDEIRSVAAYVHSLGGGE